MKIKLKKSHKKAIQSLTVYDPADLHPVLKAIMHSHELLNNDLEHFWVIGLSQSKQISFIELIRLGDFDVSEIKAPEIFRRAISTDTKKIVLVRRVLSENLESSASDKDLSLRMIIAGTMLKIEILEYLILSEGEEFVSFHALTLLEKIQSSVNKIAFGSQRH